MKNYWDTLPIELQDYILDLKDELIKKEQQEIVISIPVNTLIDYSISKFNSCNTIISTDYICKIQKIDIKLIIELIEFEMILNDSNQKKYYVGKIVMKLKR